MASEDEDDDALELIVRRKKIPPHESGVAAWKIAYADFVTAMMAFFLLLWLLNASMTVDMMMVGNSFTPDADAYDISATGNMFNAGGSNNEKVDGKIKDQTVVDNTFTLDEKVDQVVLENIPDAKRLTNREKYLQGETSENDSESAVEDIQNQMLKALRQIHSDNPSETVNVNIFTDSVGLNVEFMNNEGQRTFRRNSSKMTRPLRNILFVASRFFARLDRQIMITGHAALEGDTARQWELSMERADVTRQYLTRMGIPERRIFGIGGKGSSFPINRAEPNSDENIRVQITLLAKNDSQVEVRDVRGSAPPRISD